MDKESKNFVKIAILACLLVSELAIIVDSVWRKRAPSLMETTFAIWALFVCIMIGLVVPSFEQEAA